MSTTTSAPTDRVGALAALVADRERIARDLHDTAIQELFAAQLLLQSTIRRPPVDLEQRLAELIDQLDGVIRDIRGAIFGLTDRRRGVSLCDQADAVVVEAARMLGFCPSFEARGPVDSTAPAVADHVVPVLREALSNVARHAHASQVDVELEHLGGLLTLRVADDGVGPDLAPARSGSGIGNVAERARLLGGTSSLLRAGTHGCIFTWAAPA